MRGFRKLKFRYKVNKRKNCRICLLRMRSCCCLKGENRDIKQFLSNNDELIQRTIEESAQSAGSSIKCYVSLETRLVRECEDGQQSIETTFRSDVHFNFDFDVDRVANEIVSQIDWFNREGSSWQFDTILSAKLTTAIYRPLAG